MPIRALKILCVVLLAAAPAAHASSIGLNDHVLTITGTGADDSLTLTQPSPSVLRLRDGNGTVEAGAGCAVLPADSHVAECPAIDVEIVTMSLGKGNDTATAALAGAPRVAVIFGGIGNDQLTGSGETVARLLGNDGDDTLRGGDGDDILTGGAGADRIDGNGGIDTVSYADGRTTRVSVSLEDETVDQGGADDQSASGARDRIVDVENVEGGAGDDALTGDGADNRLTGNGGSDDLHGGRGADRLDGGDDRDELDGGDGFDTVTYASRHEGVVVTLDDTRNDGGPSDGSSPTNRDRVLASVEAVVGGDGDDLLVGDDKTNTLQGGDGNDHLTGGGGADDIDGGDGVDTVDYSDRSEPLVVTLDGNADDGGVMDGDGDNIRVTVERVFGGSGQDRLVAGMAAVEFHGGGGDDRLIGGDGDDQLFGQGGDDELDGGAGRDVLVAEFGDDVIRARDGVADAIDCDQGDDTTIVDPADATTEDCEHVVLPAASAPVAPPAPGTPTAEQPTPPAAPGDPAPAAPVVTSAAPPDRTAPRVSHIGVRRIGRTRQLRLVLSEAATVEVVAQRFGRGGRARTVRKLRFAAQAGVSRHSLGRFGPGRFRVVLEATDGAGNRSSPSRAAFT